MEASMTAVTHDCTPSPKVDARRKLGLGLILMWLAVSPANTQSLGSVPTLPLPALEHAYLECEREALAGRLDEGRIARCSVLYEDLKRRAFDGSFARLKVWTENHRAAWRPSDFAF
jgi:hypothetical protein